MNTQLKNIFLTAAVLMPISADAIEVSGKDLEVYGKIHVSIENSDRDDPAVTNDGMSISSNSSRLGFKGKKATESGIDIIWQVEQEVSVDDASAGNFANRNTYIGLASNGHSFTAGVHDTPFKSVASAWGFFGDSVAERRSILGASYTRGNQLNERVKNMAMYQFKNKPLKFQAMYAVDAEDNAGGSSVDDNDSKMMGLGLWYKVGGLKLSAGWEDWKKHSAIEDGSAYRVAAVYGAGSHQLGLIFENINTDGLTANALTFKRAAYGVNWKWNASDKADIRVQYLIADSADATTDTGASKLGLGVYYKLDKNAKVYLAYASTDNDINARFQAVDGGHGDEVKTINGGQPQSISTGIEYKF